MCRNLPCSIEFMGLKYHIHMRTIMQKWNIQVQYNQSLHWSVSRQSKWRWVFFWSRNVLCNMHYFRILSRPSEQSKLSARMFLFTSKILRRRYHNAMCLKLPIIPSNVLCVWYESGLSFRLSFDYNEKFKDLEMCEFMSHRNFLWWNVRFLCEQMSIRLLHRKNLVWGFHSSNSKMRISTLMPQHIFCRWLRSVMCSNLYWKSD